MCLSIITFPTEFVNTIFCENTCLSAGGLLHYRKMEGKAMVRFFVSAEELEQGEVSLTGENAQHARVLRLKPGEAVLLCDGEEIGRASCRERV